MVPEVQWDDLGPDALREAVLRVHNTVMLLLHEFRLIPTPHDFNRGSGVRSTWEYFSEHERCWDGEERGCFFCSGYLSAQPALRRTGMQFRRNFCCANETKLAQSSRFLDNRSLNFSG